MSTSVYITVCTSDKTNNTLTHQTWHTTHTSHHIHTTEYIYYNSYTLYSTSVLGKY